MASPEIVTTTFRTGHLRARRNAGGDAAAGNIRAAARRSGRRQDGVRPRHGRRPRRKSRRRVEPDVRADSALQGTHRRLCTSTCTVSRAAAAIDDLGLEELASGAVVAIEWAERLPRPLEGSVTVKIEDLGDERRRITIGERELGNAELTRIDSSALPS